MDIAHGFRRKLGIFLQILKLSKLSVQSILIFIRNKKMLYTLVTIILDPQPNSVSNE